MLAPPFLIISTGKVAIRTEPIVELHISQHKITGGWIENLIPSYLLLLAHEPT